MRPEEAWITLAPGVRFLARRPDGLEDEVCRAEVARQMAAVFDGRRTLEELGFGDEADLGVLSDPSVLTGLASFAYGLECGARFIADWAGVTDETGEPLPVTREAVAAALRYGSEDGPALLRPWLAYLDGPREALGAELRRLRKLAEWKFGGGGEHCSGCDLVQAACVHGASQEPDDDGRRALCPVKENAPLTVAGRAAWEAVQSPGVWTRAGMDGAISGLDYKAALMLAEEAGAPDGSVFACLRAIEGAALSALAARRPRNAESVVCNN